MLIFFSAFICMGDAVHISLSSLGIIKWNNELWNSLLWVHISRVTVVKATHIPTPTFVPARVLSFNYMTPPFLMLPGEQKRISCFSSVNRYAPCLCSFKLCLCKHPLACRVELLILIWFVHSFYAMRIPLIWRLTVDMYKRIMICIKSFLINRC